MSKYIISILCFFIITTVIYAQAQTDLSTKSKKAKKCYLTAVEDLTAYKYEIAIIGFKKAIDIDPKFVEAYIMLATSYEELHDYEKAIDYYKQAIEIDEKVWPNLLYLTALLEIKQGKYKDAKEHFSRFLEKHKTNPISEERCIKGITQCDFAIEQINNPKPFAPINLGPNINTKHNDYSPTLTADEKTLILTISRPSDAQTECRHCKEEEDFFISHKINGEWTKIVSIGSPVNTHGNEGAQCISPDGKTIIYTACNRKKGYGSCDLYSTVYEGNKWATPINMGAIVNSSSWDSQPSISSDGKTIYFSSGRKGGVGGMDIWYTQLGEDMKWGKPVNLGKTINTSKNEMSPFIHPDNQTLYFASNGHLGMGDMDIFYCRRNAEGNWSEPINIGYPINTHGDEACLIVNAKGDCAYFSSNKLDGEGKLDLYSFNLYKEARPVSVTYLKGKVYDKDTRKNIKAKFELINLKTEEITIESYSDAISGEFVICLPTESEYALNVSKNGYLFYSEHFKLTGEHSKAKPFYKDIPLKPIKNDEIVILRNIFFDTDKYELKEESKIELQKLITLLSDNKNINIEIRGHTDNVSSKSYNQELSENRAKSVFNYLINNGINKLRLSYKGYGMDKPIDTNDTEEGRANNRRTEFKLISH